MTDRPEQDATPPRAEQGETGVAERGFSQERRFQRAGAEGGPSRRGGPPGRFRAGPRRRVCAFCVDKLNHVDYKDVARLRSYMNDRGKILKSRQSGCCAKHQRMVSHAIRRAREIALLPFVNE